MRLAHDMSSSLRRASPFSFLWPLEMGVLPPCGALDGASGDLLFAGLIFVVYRPSGILLDGSPGGVCCWRPDGALLGGEA